MRALIAGLFVFVMLIIAVGFADTHSKNDSFPWWGIPFILLTGALSITAVFLVFNKRYGSYALPGQSHEQRISDWEKEGMLDSETFEASRAFEVNEIEDEGSHFFIELKNGCLLYLNGQYLYDYRGATKDREGNPKIPFPASRFTIRRHKTSGNVVDIICEGDPLPIECVAPVFNKKDFELDLVPEDGQIIGDRSYDQIKKERLKSQSGVY